MLGGLPIGTENPRTASRRFRAAIIARVQMAQMVGWNEILSCHSGRDGARPRPRAADRFLPGIDRNRRPAAWISLGIVWFRPRDGLPTRPESSVGCSRWPCTQNELSAIIPERGSTPQRRLQGQARYPWRRAKGILRSARERADRGTLFDLDRYRRFGGPNGNRA